MAQWKRLYVRLRLYLPNTKTRYDFSQKNREFKDGILTFVRQYALKHFENNSMFLSLLLNIYIQRNYLTRYHECLSKTSAIKETFCSLSHPIISQREGFTLQGTLLFITVWRFCMHSAITAFNKRTGGTTLCHCFLLFHMKWQSPSPNSRGIAHSTSRSPRRSLRWGWAAWKQFKTDSRVTEGEDRTQYGGKLKIGMCWVEIDQLSAK